MVLPSLSVKPGVPWEHDVFSGVVESTIRPPVMWSGLYF